jgi:hypothetical protein
VLLRLPVFDQLWPAPKDALLESLDYLGLNSRLPSNGTYLASGDMRAWGILLSWLLIHDIGKCYTLEALEADELSRAWLDDWLLGKVLQTTLVDLGLDQYSAGKMIDLVRVLVAFHNWHQEITLPKGRVKAQFEADAYRLLKTWLNDDGFQMVIGMNRYHDTVWFNKEAFEEIMWWLFVVAVIEIQAESDSGKTTSFPRGADQIIACYAVIRRLLAAEAGSDFQVDLLLKAAEPD